MGLLIWASSIIAFIALISIGFPFGESLGLSAIVWWVLAFITWPIAKRQAEKENRLR